jgi:hypothetical protein
MQTESDPIGSCARCDRDIYRSEHRRPNGPGTMLCGRCMRSDDLDTEPGPFGRRPVSYGESKVKYSLEAAKLALHDPDLFAHIMSEAGMSVTPRDNNPLRESVQDEEVASVASVLMEDHNARIELSAERRALKRLAESNGYIVSLKD